MVDRYRRIPKTQVSGYQPHKPYPIISRPFDRPLSANIISHFGLFIYCPFANILWVYWDSIIIVKLRSQKHNNRISRRDLELESVITNDMIFKFFNIQKSVALWIEVKMIVSRLWRLRKGGEIIEIENEQG